MHLNSRHFLDALLSRAVGGVEGIINARGSDSNKDNMVFHPAWIDAIVQNVSQCNPTSKRVGRTVIQQNLVATSICMLVATVVSEKRLENDFTEFQVFFRGQFGGNSLLFEVALC